MPTTAFATIEPELRSRLGQIVINWAVIEEWLGHLLGTLINSDLSAVHVLTNEMGAGTVIQAIKTILSIFEPKQPDLKILRELVEEADELRLERNNLVHGVWDPTNCEPGTCLVQTTGWKRAEIIRGGLVTTAELDQLLRDFDHWIEEYVTLGRRFGFPRARGETGSIFSDC
jgi:hypothetical protein